MGEYPVSLVIWFVEQLRCIFKYGHNERFEMKVAEIRTTKNNRNWKERDIFAPTECFKKQYTCKKRAWNDQFYVETDMERTLCIGEDHEIVESTFQGLACINWTAILHNEKRKQ